MLLPNLTRSVAILEFRSFLSSSICRSVFSSNVLNIAKTLPKYSYIISREKQRHERDSTEVRLCNTLKEHFWKHVFSCYQRIYIILVSEYVLYRFGNSVSNWHVSVEQGKAFKRFSEINIYNTSLKFPTDNRYIKRYHKISMPYTRRFFSF